jgi:hypothetical protein
MKQILLSLFMVFGLMSSPTPLAKALTEGCPDTWKIDTNSREGFAELQQAKVRLGSDLALSVPITQYLNYSGELGALAPPKVSPTLTTQDIYLYGKTQVQWKIDVQLKNCPTKTSFVINLGSLTEYLGFKNLITNVDPQTWASANERLFVDFTKAAKFGACVKSIQLSTAPPNSSGQLEGDLLVMGFGGIGRQSVYNDPYPCGMSKVDYPGYFTYQDLTPGCRYFSEQSDRSTAIRKGGSCDLALSLPTVEGLIVFSKFTIKAKDYEVKVTCVKGKLSKTFTTYRGYEFRVKCPAGYKLKK